ncbi:PREDICTED: proteoglycan 3-like [Ficedula albicollis]|uniref:proteoglycan 3-like n=1 Tax=Ficedula albicollis TaxID=59894 RepID=UPI0007AD89A7|nr:PREDICTED: proteoglycan 3-like [Ficedula albicollis]
MGTAPQPPEGAGGVPSVPACPTAMWPCLLLALALLGTVPASHPGPCQLQGLPAGETPQLRYTVVNKLRTYSGAQRYCQDVYRGQLASVHSSARNQELQKLAKTYNKLLSPWIGAVTSRRVRGHQGKWAAKGLLGAGKISWGLLWGVRGWVSGAGCRVPGAGAAPCGMSLGMGC